MEELEELIVAGRDEVSTGSNNVVLNVMYYKERNVMKYALEYEQSAVQYTPCSRQSFIKTPWQRRVTYRSEVLRDSSRDGPKNVCVELTAKLFGWYGLVTIPRALPQHFSNYHQSIIGLFKRVDIPDLGYPTIKTSSGLVWKLSM